jgi:hypothetical protein
MVAASTMPFGENRRPIGAPVNSRSPKFTSPGTVKTSAAFTAGNVAATGDGMDTITFTKTAPPEWLLAMWKEIDDKTFGKGFDCFALDAICNLGVADWHGREAIRENLRQFIDRGFTAHHDVVEYWDSPLLKVFHGKVGMKFDDPSHKPVKSTMTHFFYMDEKAPAKVKRWIGAVGPTEF